MSRVGRLGRRLALLAPLLAVTMLFRSSQNMAQTTLSILGHERLHLSPGAIGATMAGSALCGVLSSVLWAPRVRPHRRAPAVGAALVMVAVALVVFGTVSDTAELAVAAVLLGVGGGLAMPTLMTLAGSREGSARGSGAERQRDRDLALYTMALSASLAIGPLVEAFVLRVSGQQLTAAYLVFAAFPVAAIVVLWIWRLHPDPPRHTDGRAGAIGTVLSGVGEGELPAGAGVPAGAQAKGRPRTRFWPGAYREIAGNRAWRAAVIGMLIYQVPFIAIVTFAGSMARVVDGASPATAEVAFGVFFATSLTARGWAAWRAPIVRKTGALWLSALLTVAGLLVLSLGHGIAWLVLAMAVMGIPHGIVFPVVLSMVAGGTDPEQLALANATFLAIVSLVAVVMPTILGALISAYGYRATMLLVLVPVIGFSALLGLPRDEGVRV
ncbi:MAG: MFS transporter [Actinomycetota bacterium]|nr:MFS transporter [Actinomycetota bacterium]